MPFRLRSSGVLTTAGDGLRGVCPKLFLRPARCCPRRDEPSRCQTVWMRCRQIERALAGARAALVYCRHLDLEIYSRDVWTIGDVGDALDAARLLDVARRRQRNISKAADATLMKSVQRPLSEVIAMICFCRRRRHRGNVGKMYRFRGCNV